jgi:hypothetical protein
MSTPAIWLPFRLSICFAVLWTATASASGSRTNAPVELVLCSGRSMRVALDHRVSIHHVGQPVTGTLVEPVYVYDRTVLPIGARLNGHIERIEQASRKKRTLAILAGDFSPHPHAILRFDAIVDSEGHTIPIVTAVRGGMLRAKPQVARNPSKDADEKAQSRISDARDAVSAQARDALALLKDPGKKERLEQLAINQLPYHPEYLVKGMVYDVELLQPVSFGSVVPSAPAPQGSLPAPDSVLTAKLTTTIDSAKTPRGAAIAAVLTQPVFSAQHELILPEGTRLAGEVTLAKSARHWRRNGQLRMLFESVQPPTETSQPLLASLYSVEAGAGAGVRVDEEGGTSIANSKTRFIAPALAVLAIRGSTRQEHELDDDGPGQVVHMSTTQGSPGAKIVGGLFGFGAIGAVASQFSRPVAIGFSVLGAARTLYTNIVAKGREVTFSADTPIQVRLAPGPSSSK